MTTTTHTQRAGARTPQSPPAVSAPTAGARDRIAELVCGHMATHAVGTAVRLGLADALGERRLSAGEVAGLTDCRPVETLRLLRALTALGLAREDDVGFELTAPGRLLRSDEPGTMRDFVLMTTDQAMLGAWRELPGAVRHGGPVFDDVFGTSFFDHLGRDAELSARFNAAMNQGTRLVGQLLPTAYDFGALGVLADVGGGDGSLLAAILAEHRHLDGWVLDTEEGLAEAPTILERTGVAARVTPVVGDFFDHVPAGADAYLLKSILHDWDDDAAARILANVRAAVPDDGRLLVVDAVLPDRAGPDRATLGYLGDLNMLVQLGGHERTEADFAQLFARTGFELRSVTSLAPARFSLVEGVPVR